MGIWTEGRGWCFCGVGRSERLKGSILSCKGPAMASIFSISNGGEGIGFLIHPSLLLTTHVTLPSVTAAEAVEILLNQGRLPARLAPYRFFITSSVLDLTIVGVDTAGDAPHYCLKAAAGNLSLDLGSTVYLLSLLNRKSEAVVGEAKVVIATDNLIKLSAEGQPWRPGSPGFDAQGNLALMICHPMRLASSPNVKFSSASSSSSTMSTAAATLFGIPLPVICNWLHQYWDHSCGSFSQRQIFKPDDEWPASIPESPAIIRRKENALLDINFPPRVPRSIIRQLLPEPSENANPCVNPGDSSLPEDGEGFSSSGEETMYSAETMESRNIPSPRPPPKEGRLLQPVGRSQSCVSYCSRWESAHQRRRGMLQKQRSAALTSQRNHDYYSPTVSSSMKKRDGSDRPVIRSRPNVHLVSPRWIL